ncbi:MULTISPECIES: DNA recombination protein RmuC [Rhizobium]|uniref:DNA recombination protein RmuC homolog n=1 Tax=Rhizobium rhododendri TaxID=2506430 RepID=A0ABY8IIE3_9HYPH|nr:MULTISPECIES: DNA recombination protein RmuC [Rhizobium]MBZ5759849.1 DNA recombination protein RmuC [Rhizobium sp. VS19-DR96]MBZ5766237.1 DNA recombination protein RmuC [Rhizobium sp. VS19-DR129.2]MBZ5773020.1 DNA recombination protein RmuC [Rhizobium sp. VS19-DRK62.2]MBZ5784004.1 DNA recombination protein RmuC [Rhizobium sp. VS19-DR121]MBZ5803581.1 DNA recombination protein RmuC [Rhizobium sp. VS19-DR181]
MTISLFGSDFQTVQLLYSAVGLLVLVIVILLVRSAGRRQSDDEMDFRAAEAEQRMAEMLRLQAEMQGRLATMTEVFGSRQAEFNHAVNQRLDGMSHRVTSTLNEQTKSTHENLQKLQERLGVIDAAQTNIQSLAKDVVGLQAILSNKQTRGAFGQARMETIVADGLPFGAYAFQHTLSNGSRPDCIIHMPNGLPPLVVDAKFPLEAWNAIRAASSPEMVRIAGQQFRRDMEVHIRDISEKYLIQGETQDTAFLFVPSESIFAEIHEKFEGVIQKAHRAQIVIVSPSLLMLSIQVIQSVLKDQRMREQAHLIQGEVALLMADLGRLDERVTKLQGHFSAAQKDVEMIATSSSKLARRGQKIEALDLTEHSEAVREPAEPSRGVESRTGLLKLRVVDED